MSKIKSNSSMSKLSEFRNWYEFKTDKSKLENKLNSIIDFYVFSCPSYNTNVQAMQLSDYGWVKGVDKSSLTRRLKNIFPKGKFVNVNTYDELFDSLNNIEELIKVKTICESVCIKTDNSAIAEALFYAIRNAYAHGSFTMKKIKGEAYFILENRKRGVLTARMIVKAQTLEKWIEILKNK